MVENKRILAVDDEEPFLEILSFNLEGDGYSVDTCLSAEEAMRKNLHTYDLFILDVMMGQVSGFRLAEKIRKELALSTPIIFLTARDTENDRITGFKAGADDYLAKPYDAQELQARVRAITRRTMSRERIEVKFSDLNLHRLEKICWYNSKNTLLTAKEFDLLFCLIETPGRVWSKHDLLAKVWGQVAAVESKTVEVTIKNIRKKLLDVESKVKILNERHHGYWVET